MVTRTEFGTFKMTGTPLSLNQPGITRLIRYNLRDFYIELILELKRNKLPIVRPRDSGPDGQYGINIGQD